MNDQEPASDLERRRWEEFGAWLREVRVSDRGETRARIAELADMSLQTLAALEAGGFRRTGQGAWIIPNPKDETLDTLARALKVDPAEMFRRVGRYEDRPQTKRSLRRRNLRGVSSQGERLAALEQENAGLRAQQRSLEEILADTNERLERVERELAALRKQRDQPERKRASG